MSQKSNARKIYEAHVVTESLAILTTRMNLRTLPLAPDELQTLARHAREAFRAGKSEEKRERRRRYAASLAARYGEMPVIEVCGELERINNEIGYREK